MIKFMEEIVECIVEFGNLSVDQQLDILEAKLQNKDILLFQFYEKNSEFIGEEEYVNECFDNYCDDIIHYYNPKLQEEIKQAIYSELIKNCFLEREFSDIRRKEEVEKLYNEMKRGEYTNISGESITAVKQLVFDKIIKYNKNEPLYKYIDERKYGKSTWILDERGKVYNAGGAIWYKPANRKEALEILERFPIFSCIVLKEGEQLDNFLIGYTVIETASNYDLLIFNNT